MEGFHHALRLCALLHQGAARKGNSLQDQEQKLRAAGAEEIYSDSFTGTTMDRPQFTALLSRLQAGDELMVTKLD